MFGSIAGFNPRDSVYPGTGGESHGGDLLDLSTEGALSSGLPKVACSEGRSSSTGGICVQPDDVGKRAVAGFEGLNPATENSNVPISVFKTGSLDAAGDGLVVEGLVNNQQRRIIIDTGSNVSIVRPDVVGETVSMVQAHSYLRTVSGERAPIHGTMMLDITIGSKTFHQKVWVADVVDECLLGLHFLVSHECQVDLKDGILYIGGEEVPLAKPGAALSEPRCFRAVTSRTVSVAPYSEAILCTQVVGLGGDERWGIVEAAGSSGQVVEGVLVGRTLVDLQQPEVPVRVMNLSDQPRTISKGTDLAACEELCSVQPFRPHKGSALDEMPPHLAELYEKSIEGLTQAEAEQVRKLLVEYADVFSRGSEDLGRTDLVKHHIRTGDAIPIKQPPRRMPLTLREEAKKAVEEMVQQKVIEPAEGPWSSPVGRKTAVYGSAWITGG